MNTHRSYKHLASYGYGPFYLFKWRFWNIYYWGSLLCLEVCITSSWMCPHHWWKLCNNNKLFNLSFCVLFVPINNLEVNGTCSSLDIDTDVYCSMEIICSKQTRKLTYKRWCHLPINYMNHMSIRYFVY